jgi:chorismate mutase
MSPIKESSHNLTDVRLPATMAELQDIRDSIDNIDASIIHMLAERFRRTQRVGVLKAQHSLPPSAPDREAQQITRLRHLASAAKLDPEFAEKFLALSFAKSFGIMKLPGADAYALWLAFLEAPQRPLTQE